MWIVSLVFTSSWNFFFSLFLSVCLHSIQFTEAQTFQTHFIPEQMMNETIMQPLHIGNQLQIVYLWIVYFCIRFSYFVMEIIHIFKKLFLLRVGFFLYLEQRAVFVKCNWQQKGCKLNE